MKKYSGSQKVWRILADAAKNNKTLTYSQLGEKTGFNHRKLGTYLYPIQHFCKKWDIPQLTILVVLKSTGRPSSGIDGQEFEKKRKKVFGHTWPEPPSIDELSDSDLDK